MFVEDVSEWVKVWIKFNETLLTFVGRQITVQLETISKWASFEYLQNDFERLIISINPITPNES